MSEIIEDTISRDRKFREERQALVKKLKELKAPDILIENEEKISKMSLAEYEIYRKECEKADKKIKSEYAKNNPIQKSIVDEIYLRESKLEYDYFMYLSDFSLMVAINPLDFMSKDDYDNELYKPFLEHTRELYRNRYKEHFRVDNERQD